MTWIWGGKGMGREGQDKTQGDDIQMSRHRRKFQTYNVQETIDFKIMGLFRKKNRNILKHNQKISIGYYLLYI